jgi:hypothetical protein
MTKIVNVRFRHIADITTRSINVRFGGKADTAAKLLIRKEARRIAANLAKLPELWPHIWLLPACLTHYNALS